MRVITHCPVCQTQFFATEEQLNKHGGKVRCGQCLHVFDAKAQLITVAEGADEAAEQNISVKDNPASADIKETEPAITTTLPDATSAETAVNDDTPATITGMQPSYLNDAVDNARVRPARSLKPRRWPWAVGILLLLLLGCLQTVYFLRDDIAIHYPELKPYLIQVCQPLSCSINLPRQIESIIIDDSDMQEDADHAGLVRFSSTLINQGNHVLAYPNLELTLTDVDDRPVLRRIFKPAEYLPTGSSMEDGIRAGEQIRIQLAITTENVAVAGYRVFVTY